MTLLEWLTNHFPAAKRQTLKQMVSRRRVLVNDSAASKLSQALRDGDVVRVLPRAGAPAPRASLHPLTLVHEDDDILVIDKPAGLLTSTVAREKRPTALAVVRAYVMSRQPRARVGLIHRLDRDASGLLIFSKSHIAYESLKTQFFKHTVERVYEAAVHGKLNPPKGTIDTRLIERADGTVRSTDEHAKGQRAISEYQTIRTQGGQSKVLVKLRTGRKHQIRVHLSERGCPIVGDWVYGKVNDPPPLLLRAVRLVIDHPRTGKRTGFDVTSH